MSETDRRFDELVENAVSGPPPAYTDVTPWRRAMARVLTGLCLTSVTLNFFNLNYILAAVGHLMMLCGFRALRGENRAFGALFASELLRAGLFFAGAVLGATRFYYAEAGQGVLLPLSAAGWVLQLAQPPLLWAAVRAVQAKAGIPKHAASALWLLVWYCLILVLGLAGAGLGWIGGIGFLAAFAPLICSLRRLYSALDAAGYAVRPLTPRVSDLALALGILAAAAALTLCAGLIFAKYPMDWRPLEGERGEEARAVGASLAELGFPEDILADMSDEDILACEGAYEVYTELDYLSERRSESGYENVSSKTVRHVVVYLPGNEIRLVQHFVWDEGAHFYGTEALQLWPAWKFDGFRRLSDTTGRVLYDRGGETLAAGYFLMSEEDYRGNPAVYAAFSFPNSGERWRGYVTYAVESVEPGWPFDSYMNYARRERPFAYPCYDAVYYLRSGMWDITGATGIEEEQHAVQFRVWW